MVAAVWLRLAGNWGSQRSKLGASAQATCLAEPWCVLEGVVNRVELWLKRGQLPRQNDAFFGSIIDSGTKALAPQSERSGHAKERVASRQGIPFGARTQNHSRLA